MGEIADMMLEGVLCQGCGEFLGEGDGYPEFCAGCQKEQKTDKHEEPLTTTKDGTPINRPTKINCPRCNKLVKKAGLNDHLRDVHGSPAKPRG